EFNFMEDHTVAQIAPSAIFAFSGYSSNQGAYVVNCDNPYLVSSGLEGILCESDTDSGTPGVQPNCPDTDGGTPGNQALCLVDLRYRNVLGGPRQADLTHTEYRLVAGLRGEFAEGWSYDLSGMFSTTLYNQVYRNEVSLKKVSNGLIVDDLGG